jgi:4-hydroxythreonine-4-phosphate dehydrogenase
MGKTKPTLGITMGDPMGVGAEILLGALADTSVGILDRANVVIFGLTDSLQSAAERMSVPLDGPGVRIVDFPEHRMPAGAGHEPSAAGGAASLAFCESAIEAAMNHRVDAIVTAPISKTSWRLAGVTEWPGHTELLKERTGAEHVAMMFHSPQLRVTLASIHEPIAALPSITSEQIERAITLSSRALREWWQMDAPRIGVAGLNPHAGENGHIGDEEARIIAPAIARCQASGIDATGPIPGDTIFLRALDGQFDLVVAMYHDQGLIPVKLLGWEEAVNVTLGLPILRTSPDHGTAFDIAGQGLARPGSMIAAIQLATKLTNK